MSAALEFTAPAFGLKPPFDGSTARTCGSSPGRRRLETLSQQIRQSSQRPLTVLPLGTLLSRNNPQTVPLDSRRQLVTQASLAERTKDPGILQVESQLHPGISGIHTLPPRTRGPGETPLQLRGWNHQTVIDRQILNHAPLPKRTGSGASSLRQAQANHGSTLFLAGRKNLSQPS